MGSMLFALTLYNIVIHTSYYLSIWCSILPCFCNVYKHTPFLLKWVEIWKKSQFKKTALKTFNNLYRTTCSCAKVAWWFNQFDLSLAFEYVTFEVFHYLFTVLVQFVPFLLLKQLVLSCRWVPSSEDWYLKSVSKKVDPQYHINTAQCFLKAEDPNIALYVVENSETTFWNNGRKNEHHPLPSSLLINKRFALNLML